MYLLSEDGFRHFVDGIFVHVTIYYGSCFEKTTISVCTTTGIYRRCITKVYIESIETLYRVTARKVQLCSMYNTGRHWRKILVITGSLHAYAGSQRGHSVLFLFWRTHPAIMFFFRFVFHYTLYIINTTL